jgi:hypothetical protein
LKVFVFIKDGKILFLLYTKTLCETYKHYDLLERKTEIIAKVWLLPSQLIWQQKYGFLFYVGLQQKYLDFRKVSKENWCGEANSELLSKNNSTPSLFDYL